MASPSNLGTYLIQRLDMLLGHPLSQQASLARSSDPRTVAATHQSVRLDAPAPSTHHLPEESVEQARQTQQKRLLPLKQAAQAAQTPIAQETHTTAGERPPSAAAITHLSQTAQRILALLETHPHSPPLQHPPLLLSEHPEADGAPPQRTMLAQLFLQALTRAVQNSGLFYESHLSRALYLPSERALHSGGPSTPESKGLHAPHNTVHQDGPSSPTLLRQQLEVLATQALSWQGFAWDGVPGQWHIERKVPSSPSPEQEDAWVTSVQLDLPRLGPIQARLLLGPHGLEVRIQAGSAAAMLAEHAPDLRAALQPVAPAGVRVNILPTEYTRDDIRDTNTT